jgi:hypothetical protein
MCSWWSEYTVTLHHEHIKFYAGHTFTSSQRGLYTWLRHQPPQTPITYYTKNVQIMPHTGIYTCEAFNKPHTGEVISAYFNIEFILTILTFYHMRSASFSSVDILVCAFTSWTFKWICALVMIRWRWHLCWKICRDPNSFNTNCYTFLHRLVFVSLQEGAQCE